uniref:Putative nuclease HARBI1 n=1 Tax=Salarias fasciatus TaxID=181472 RepID=A0A672HG15_SALFA
MRTHRYVQTEKVRAFLDSVWDLSTWICALERVKIDAQLLNRAFRRERVFKDRADLFSESSEWLLSKYRFPKDVLMDLCCDVQPMLERETKRSNPIPAHVQLMSTLGCLANGTFQREMADIYGVSQPTMSRILPTVLDAIISLAPTYIQFPYENHRQAEIKQGFHAVAGFPNIIGAIGCTHIAIKAPSHNECSYINSEGYHSINTQIICDSTMSLLNVVARWPGGTPDSSILQNSSCFNISKLLSGLSVLYYVISTGDRGYPLKPWLMTPVANPSTPQEQHYNRAHARSRAVVDHAVGLLKGRWLCLSNVGGILKYEPKKVCQIILACCVLHNLAIKRGVPLQEPPREDKPLLSAEPFPPPDPAAIQTRETIIQRFR